MPQLFESLVRPFQKPNSVNDKSAVITIVTQAPSEIPILSWGAAGTPPSPFINFKVIDKQNTEISRTAKDIRIENPDDSDQFVVAQQIESIKFSGGKTLGPESDDPNSYRSGNANGVSSNTGFSSKAQEFPLASNPAEIPVTSNPNGVSLGNSPEPAISNSSAAKGDRNSYILNNDTSAKVVRDTYEVDAPQ